MLSKNAFNALLKTLEEPPPNTVFIFATTEFNKVLPTIVSRCQHFEFKKISQKDIVDHLAEIAGKENLTISSFGLNMLAEASDGSLRDAQSLLDQAVSFCGDNIQDDELKEILGTFNREILFHVSAALFEQKAEEIFSVVSQVVDSGYDIRYFLKELIFHFRNLLLVKTVKKHEDLLPLGREDLEKIKNESDKFSLEELLRFLVSLQHGEEGLRFSSQPRIFLETLLVKLCHFKKIVPLKELLKELKETKDTKPEPVKSVEQKAASYGMPESRIQEKRGKNHPASTDAVPEADKPEEIKAEKKDTIPETKRERDVDRALKDPDVTDFMEEFKAQILSAETKKEGKDK
jgi:DNA polymerase-3 subunit gamma/tau